MRIVEIKSLDNGAHRNQIICDCEISIPNGWAIIPDDMECKNFPFGELETREEVRTREVEVVRTVNKTRELPDVDEDGKEITRTEEYTEEEFTIEVEEYTVLVVSGWIPKDITKPKKIEQKPSRIDIIEAQITYTAMMTDTLLEE